MTAKHDTLLRTSTIVVCDVVQATGAAAAEAPPASRTALAFVYRGVFVRHAGGEIIVAEPNQVLFFNAGEPHRIAYPLAEGAAYLRFEIEEALLGELAPAGIIREHTPLRFSAARLRIDPRAQALVAMLRYSLRENIAEPLEAESLALTLAQRSLGPRTTHAAGASASMQKLVDRVKLVLTADLARDAGGDRRGSWRVAGLSHASVSPSRGRAALSLPIATPTREGFRPDGRL